MKRADEAVEKVLAGLRGVEVDPCFEERMVRRVRGVLRERGAGGRFGVWQWVAVGCMAILLFGVGVNSRRQGRRDFFATNVGLGREARGQAGPGEVGAVEEGVSQRLKPGRGLRGSGTAEAVPLSKAGFLGREAMQRLMRVGEEAKYSRNAGSLEVMGAGFPAPPLPLTAQERLLLRAAREGDPLPAAVLEVSALPANDKEEKTEFTEFFGQDRQIERSKPGESE